MITTGTAEKQSEIKEQQCPECGAAMPVHPGYVTWCDNCGWNLRPYVLEQPKNVLERLYVALGRRFSGRLFAELVRQESLKPQPTPAKLLAYVIATAVHGVTLLFAVLALWLIVGGWPGLLPMGVGIVCAMVAWTLRPRVARLEKDAEIAAPEEFPTLYRVAGQVAQALNTSPPAIIVDTEFSAAFGQLGWRRRKVMRLGLPLFVILGPQERVALIGHEIAHGVNGDLNRGLYIGTAINSLVTWYEILYPGRIWDDTPETGFYAMPANAVMWVLSKGAYLVLLMLAHLLWQDMQRAEYLADALAARAAGSEAALGMLNKLHYANTFLLTLQRVSLAGGKNDLFGELRRAVAMVPGREVERIRRVEQMEESRLDATHPPTPLRLELLRARPMIDPQVILSQEDFQQMETELAAVQTRIQAELIDQHQASIYH